MRVGVGVRGWGEVVMELRDSVWAGAGGRMGGNDGGG